MVRFVLRTKGVVDVNFRGTCTLRASVGLPTSRVLSACMCEVKLLGKSCNCSATINLFGSMVGMVLLVVIGTIMGGLGSNRKV